MVFPQPLGPSRQMNSWGPLSSDTFDDAALALAEQGYRAIVPDRRGFGRSDQPWDGYDYDTFADDVAAVVLDAGVNEPIALAGFHLLTPEGKAVLHTARVSVSDPPMNPDTCSSAG